MGNIECRAARTQDLEGGRFPSLRWQTFPCYIVPPKCKINGFSNWCKITIRSKENLYENSIYNSINYSANMSAKSILRWCYPAKMLIMSSKFSSIPYLMCMSASLVILSCPMVEWRYVLRRRRTLILRSHSLIVRGNVQIKRRSIWMFGNMDSLAYSSDFEGVSGSPLFSTNFHALPHMQLLFYELFLQWWICLLICHRCNMLRAIIALRCTSENLLFRWEIMSSKEGIVIALLKYYSGLFEGIFSLFVWWVHLRGREGGNALILPPSYTESYNLW